MTSGARHPGDFEWKHSTIIVPRLGLMVTRHGVHTALILPGRYMVRRSRSLGRWIYRRPG